MVNLHFTFGRMGALAVVMSLAGCMGGMDNNNGLAALAGNGLGNGNPLMGAVEGAVINSAAQNMVGSVLNGQVASVLNPMEQNYRTQQLGQVLQSGLINQAQKWTHPQTGTSFSLNPIGQQGLDQQSQQTCQTLQETVVLQNGQRVTENRRACQNPQTGQWALVQ